MPIFRYRGQLTLHGIFESENKSITIGGYKNIIVNGNGSIGVKYNAIDYDKKETLGCMLYHFGYHFHRDSQSEYYIKSFCPSEGVEVLKEGVKEYQSINIEKYLAIKNLLKDNLSGRIYIVIYVHAILESDVLPMFTAITGKTEIELDKQVEIYKAKEQAKKEAYELEEIESRKQAIEKRKNELENNPFISEFNALKDWDKQFKDNVHLVVMLFNYNHELEFRHYRLNKKGAWYSAKKISNKDLHVFNFDSCFSEKTKSEKTPEELVKRIGGLKNNFKIYSK
jgi:hypothetical protein